MKILPTLYKTSSKGATQVLNMEITDDTYTRIWGQLDGKMQSKSTIAKPKNIGRANATTASEQAIIEAKAVWVKKQKANYSTSKEAPVTVNLPMKVKSLQDQIKNIIYPCVSTPKLNGINGTYSLVNNELVLTSRGGEVYSPIPHLEDEVRNVMKLLNSKVLNGELYIRGEYLQDITSATKKPKELSKRLTFNIFDIPDSTEDYEARRELMLDAEALLEEDAMVLLLTGIECDNMNELEAHYNQCMEVGLEGTVVKNLNGLYKYNTRSTSQFKYKKTQDAEFKIIGFNIDKNEEIVFKMQTQDKTPFKCKPKGSRTYRQLLAKTGEEQVGTWWTVEYEVLSKVTNTGGGVPLKPVATCQRLCDSLGNPKV